MVKIGQGIAENDIFGLQGSFFGENDEEGDEGKGISGVVGVQKSKTFHLEVCQESFGCMEFACLAGE